MGQEDTTEIIHGKVALREVAEVLDWARSNSGFLAAKFEELQQLAKTIFS